MHDGGIDEHRDRSLCRGHVQPLNLLREGQYSYRIYKRYFNNLKFKNRHERFSLSIFDQRSYDNDVRLEKVHLHLSYTGCILIYWRYTGDICEMFIPVTVPFINDQIRSEFNVFFFYDAYIAIIV
jgi:hypothetical protein